LIGISNEIDKDLCIDGDIPLKFDYFSNDDAFLE